MPPKRKASGPTDRPTDIPTDGPTDEKDTTTSTPASIQMSSAIPLSKEQHDVVKDILIRKNVTAIAKAGSGKSSVAIACAQQFYEKYKSRTLLITYNARLKFETRERIKKMGLDHAIEAHSYHAAASKFFVEQKNTGADNALIHAATQVENPIAKLEFGLIVVDEAQDMNELYSRFIIHTLKHCREKPTMLIVGDPFQRIFGFNGATCDFLVNPKQVFGEFCHTSDFSTHHLSICWRITHEMAKFINTHLNPCNLQHSVDPAWWDKNKDRISAWWGKGIRANPKRPPQPDSFKIVRGNWGSKEILDQTKKMFSKFGNDEVALIAFSLKGERTPIRAIVDRLGKTSTENWAILAGNDSGSEEVLKGKRVASTIHRMKGLERRGIVVCGLDSFIEKLYPNDPLEHYNINYVACTRAKDQLIINATGTDYATIRCTPITNLANARQMCGVSELVAYVPFDNILSIPENLLDAQVLIAFPDKALALDRQSCLVEGRAAGTIEDLSPFMSRAISFKLMLLIHGQLFRIPVDAFENTFDRDMIDFIHGFYNTPPQLITWPSLVKYSVAYETLKTKYKHIWRQLTDYDVFTPTILLEKCTNNALRLLWELAKTKDLVKGEPIPTALQTIVDFEVPLSSPFYAPWYTGSFIGQISGVADMMFNGNTVVGIECSDSIPAERGLELAIYTSMHKILSKHPTQTVMILTNTAQLVTIDVKLKPIHPKVPIEYEIIHRSARRKLQMKPAEPEELVSDFTGKKIIKSIF